LLAAGHGVFTPTPTARERAPLHSDVDLDAHIEDAVAVMGYEELEGETLGGLGNGDMTIARPAPKSARRLARLAYLESFPPGNQKSLDNDQPASPPLSNRDRQVRPSIASRQERPPGPGVVPDTRALGETWAILAGAKERVEPS
jgi:hypothetical protein